jgi:hypothetical protein
MKKIKHLTKLLSIALVSSSLTAYAGTCDLGTYDYDQPIDFNLSTNNEGVIAPITITEKQHNYIDVIGANPTGIYTDKSSGETYTSGKIGGEIDIIMHGQYQQAGLGYITAEVSKYRNKYGKVSFYGFDKKQKKDFSCYVTENSKLYDEALSIAANLKNGTYLYVARRKNEKECFHARLTTAERFVLNQ